MQGSSHKVELAQKQYFFHVLFTRSAWLADRTALASSVTLRQGYRLSGVIANRDNPLHAKPVARYAARPKTCYSELRHSSSQSERMTSGVQEQHSQLCQ